MSAGLRSVLRGAATRAARRLRRLARLARRTAAHRMGCGFHRPFHVLEGRVLVIVLFCRDAISRYPQVVLAQIAVVRREHDAGVRRKSSQDQLVDSELVQQEFEWRTKER